LSQLQGDVWKRWVAIILDYPTSAGTGEDELRLELVASAYRHAPDDFIDTLLFLLDRENEEKGYLFILNDLRKCWDDRLARTLLEKAKDRRLKPPCLNRLLEDLLEYGLDEATVFAETVVGSWSEGDEEGRLRAVVAAQALVFHTSDAGWSVVWPAMQADSHFASELVNALASGARHSDLTRKRLSERQAADLYIWLVRRYPPSEYFIRYRDDALIAIGTKESIAMWRDAIPHNLQTRGTVEACRQLERIMSELPELDFLQWTLYQAKAETRRKTWIAPEPAQVRELTTNRAVRLVQNGGQLLEVVAESPMRLEAKLQGETPAAPDVWNECEGSYRPKDEEAFSDYVKRHLDDDLGRRGVVVNREVVIRRGEGSGRGNGPTYTWTPWFAIHAPKSTLL
jgi:hypothetical protein